ncbi:S41 family peptidase [Gemmatimonas sp.]|uniref:S41 family peptidase n=1 Tax=Gemmatimonas sp. TaxID=1962908 RepID=UPI0031BCC907|nr:hypothetical protein [Gemmatimonas sp.]
MRTFSDHSRALTLSALCVAQLAAPRLALAQTSRPTPPAPSTPAAWQGAARQDIEEAYELSVKNHPGMHDPFNKYFPGRLNAARDTARAMLPRVTDAASYSAVIARFSSVIQDGHAGAFALSSGSLPSRWPGFITVWRGNALRVYATYDGGPSVGAEVVGCDGVPIRTLIRRNVFAFQGREGEAGEWWVRARSVFVDRRNPFIAPPRACQFRANGKTTTIQLVWRDRDSTTLALFSRAYNGETLPIGLTEPRAKLFWMAMPTFSPDTAEITAYRNAFSQLTAKRNDLLAADAIVLDLRGNQGGSSEWSRQVAACLWGEDRVRRQMRAYFANVEIWWRSSAENAAYVVTAARQMREQGRPDIATEWDSLGVALTNAAARGDTFHVERNDTPVSSAVAADLPTDPPTLRTPVYVIVPGQCASACNDALDVFARFPNTVLIGAPGSGDSPYMEVRIREVASGLASVIIPNKVWVHRPRGAGVVYTPAMELRELEWSTAAFQRMIEADVMRRRTSGRKK